MKLNTLIILTASLGLAAATAQAATTIFATNPTGIWHDAGLGTTFGTPFTVGGSAMTITSLGFFDETGDGLASSHMVGIYNAAHTLMGSVVIPAGNSPDRHDGTRWEPLGTPIALSANTTYMLAATFTATGDRARLDTPGQVTLGNGFTLAGTGFKLDLAGNSSTLTYPNQALGSGEYLFGPNMEAGEAPPVPEPGQWAMMAVTAAGAAGVLWRRRKACAK